MPRSQLWKGSKTQRDRTLEALRSSHVREPRQTVDARPDRVFARPSRHLQTRARMDSVDEMIGESGVATRSSNEADWLKTSLAQFSHALQGHRDPVAASTVMLAELAALLNVQQGAVYTRNTEDDESRFDLLVAYPGTPGSLPPVTRRFHEHLVEQCALEKKRILPNDKTTGCVPAPRKGAVLEMPKVVILPALFEGEVRAVIELSAAAPFGETQLEFLDKLSEVVGSVFNTIESTIRTERLLAQSQLLTAELQAQQEELQRTNRRLRENARQLSAQMRQVKYKNREIELARAALEEKAEQLALNSRYKSEFLANMSHELRTPLNSLLILAQLLAEDPANNLTPKQIEYARTIHAAGNDLLALINDVLDLAKVESGTVSLSIASESFHSLRDYLDGAFRQLGHDRGLHFSVSILPDVPLAMQTDAKRLRQILKNLLANAFKFTDWGAVSMQIAMATSGWTPGHALLDAAESVVAFAVTDTGVGIAADKQRIIFEAFQQGDGTDNRQFGGTGLGLSISASLAHLLGGEITLKSTPGIGSTFTLYIPLVRLRDEEATKNGIAERLVPASGGSYALHVERAPGVIEAPGRSPMHDRGGAVGAADDGSALFVRNAAVDGPRPGGRARAQGAGSSLFRKRVLLVDDDIRNLFALTSDLEQQGMIVTSAERGMNGIEMLNNDPDIDIIVIDMMMPGLDGYDTIRAIRRAEHFKRVPIIGISARAMMGDREKCIAAGASGYIAKPVRVDQLLAFLRAWLVD